MVLPNFSAATLAVTRAFMMLRRRWKTTFLTALLLGALVAALVPVRSVQGLLIDTGIPVFQRFSMDANRIAAVSGGSDIFVYDIPSGLSTGLFPAPDALVLTPVLYGDKIVVAASPGLVAPTSIFYCVLPQAAAIAACPGWVLIVAGTPSIPSFASWVSFPMFNRDLVVWPVALGFSYYSFSTGAITPVALPAQPTGISTNGAIIAFVSGGTLQYVDTTSCGGPCAAADVVDTLLPASSSTGISQNIIVFNEPAPVLVRYYNVLTGIASPAGAGPLGTVSVPAATPAVWADRIVFRVAETDLGFDCNGINGIAAGESCMRYWNIQPPGVFAVPAPLLVPAAAPPITGGGGGSPGVAVYDKYIAFVGPSGTLQYVEVPMIGDIDQNGIVNILDAALLAVCFDQLLRNTPPPAGC